MQGRLSGPFPTDLSAKQDHVSLEAFRMVHAMAIYCITAHETKIIMALIIDWARTELA